MCSAAFYSYKASRFPTKMLSGGFLTPSIEWALLFCMMVCFQKASFCRTPTSAELSKTALSKMMGHCIRQL